MANTLSFSHHYSKDRWKAEIEQEQTEALRVLKQTCRDCKRRPHKDEFFHICRKIEKKCQERDFEIAAKVALWQYSERSLNLLRTKGLVHLTEEQRRHALFNFIQEVKVERFPELKFSSLYRVGMNQFYELTHPELVASFGFPFYTTVARPVADECYIKEDSNAAEEKILGINTDFWAAFMCGDHRLGHDVVFIEPENRFYFMDIVAGCYLPTSEAKVHLVASQALQNRAWGQEAGLASTMLTSFRTKKMLDEIILKAKAILAADHGYFEGSEAKPKWTDSKKAPDVDTAIVTFVKEHVEPAEAEVLAVGDCLNQFEAVGSPTQSRREITDQMKTAIASLHHIRLRNDLSLPSGRAVSGWKGLRLRPSPDEKVTLEAQSSSIRRSEHPTLSNSLEERVSNQSSELVLVG